MCENIQMNRPLSPNRSIGRQSGYYEVKTNPCQRLGSNRSHPSAHRVSFSPLEMHCSGSYSSYDSQSTYSQQNNQYNGSVRNGYHPNNHDDRSSVMDGSHCAYNSSGTNHYHSGNHVARTPSPSDKYMSGLHIPIHTYHSSHSYFDRQTNHRHTHHHHHHFISSNTLSRSSSYDGMPALSPTHKHLSRPLWRELSRSTYRPALSISSDEDEDEDEEDYLPATSPMKTYSLLSDCNEDGDDDLIPIALLNIGCHTNTNTLSAAEKYKARVRARLQL
ncbi:hypothetical protein BDB01DRAFT_775593 [Pilobolus umbonatus]|nr:hypothetical protein BDB01DRAFT_775593 [Pilobolus umbonatus]